MRASAQHNLVAPVSCGELIVTQRKIMTPTMKNTAIKLDDSLSRQEDGDEDSVVSSIYDAVMDHRLPPGTRLTESTFSKHFKVSRTIVRKALFRLAQKNIVELRPNRGAIVAQPSVEETRDVFKARQIIESAIIREVVKSIGKKISID